MVPSPNPGNEYESSYALKPSEASRVLFITRKTDSSDVVNAFASHERIGTLETQLDSKRTRVFYLYVLRGPVTAATFPSFFDRPSTD